MLQSWSDSLLDELVKKNGDKKGLELYQMYDKAMPSNYREKFDLETAVLDVELLEKVLEEKGVVVSLYRPKDVPEGEVHFKIFHPDTAVPLSESLPMLEHMGFKVLVEIPYQMDFTKSDKTKTNKSAWIHDFKLTTINGSVVDVNATKEAIQETFLAVWNGFADADGFNCLGLVAGLNWRDVVVLRAYSKYLKQAGFSLGQDYINSALASNPKLACMLVELFHQRFDPELQKDSGKKADKLSSDIIAALDSVQSADEDRILRRLLNLIESTLRTNFFQKDENGQIKEYVSFKLDSQKVEDLPLPRPMVEIWVCSPRIEGVHLRYGKIARGGLRWSDRFEDFRTEILGLVKAQQVKNVVIVPVGSKGGFVVKQSPANGTREEVQAEGISCYKTFISALLDLTDNIKSGKIVYPENVVRRDEDDDPYLVVAADKGTATFSDIANSVSQKYGFWLDDAFASGGSVGYDHKEMGITARGAWESVKRHFREIGKDIQKEDFTVVGVGDMAGDVFGNGMLLSEHIRLRAAFNHMHIFIDPNPDAATTFKERKRMFELPRSTWEDFNPKLLSKGATIFSRNEKTLTLTPEIKELFNIKSDKITPNELIKVILRSETELLWFGGIGTYIKASSQRDTDVGDHANDALRINAIEIGAKVIGEGANLGMTQLARIEYGSNNGRCYTDAVDNSAGVDCSDHEVNIKILLNEMVANGKMKLEDRNNLLASMTDEVGELVLEDNYLQSQAIEIAYEQGTWLIEDQKRLMRSLEHEGRLNREVEFLPSNEEMNERFANKQGLTRSEISILMPYSKLWLFDEILDSNLPEDPMFTDDVLIKYFPTALREKYKTQIVNHRLKREIVATCITNSLVNRVGGTFVASVMEKTGMPPSVIARAFIIARLAFSTCDIWDEIEVLDNKVPSSVQTEMLIDLNMILERITLWILHRETRLGEQNLSSMVEKMKAIVVKLDEALKPVLANVGDNYIDENINHYTNQGGPESTARRVVGFALLANANDISLISENYDWPVDVIAGLYFTIGQRYGIRWLRNATKNVPVNSHWKHLALSALEAELYENQRQLTCRILERENAVDTDDYEDAIKQWEGTNELWVARTNQLLRELKGANMVDLSMLSVISRHLGTMK